MKNLKKVLALVVALTMVFTTVAFASYPDVDASADYAGAVELLSALEILQGDDNGNFNPDNTITRAEFSAVVCRALGFEGSANGAKGATAFTDVAADHWASGYINIASQQGIVNGRGNGIFDPEGNVTFTEAVKMLVVALGYEPMAAQRGGWPTGYLTVANSTKLTAGVSATGTDTAALRSTVAQLTANALDIPVMDQTSFGTETKYEPLDDYGDYKTLLTSRDVYIVTGVVSKVEEADGEFEFEFSAYPDDFEFGYSTNGVAVSNFIGTTKTFDIGESNVADYVGQNVDIYLYKENKSDYTAIIAVPSGIGETLSIGLDDLELATYNAINGDNGVANDNNYSTLEYHETDDANKTTKIYVKENPTINVNGYKVSDGNNFSLTQSTLANNFTQLTFVENTNDKYYDIIDITIYEYGIVEDVLADKERIELTNGTKVSFDSDDDQQVAKFINAEGAVISLEDIVAGDVLAMVVGDQAASGSIAPKAAKNFDEKITIYNLGQNFVTGSVDSWDKD
ncbi:MAG: S-layer homology domain-containing protein, partial [Clostridia bacterium]|nr:S-layer homology domain-containing protein [Clostridia bacterium]